MTTQYIDIDAIDLNQLGQESLNWLRTSCRVNPHFQARHRRLPSRSEPTNIVPNHEKIRTIASATPTLYKRMA